MTTQKDMYRESQKTNAKLEQAVRLLEKAEAGTNQERVKKLEELKKEAEEANALQLKRENIERKLLGQSEKQYDAMLKQRKVSEEAKKEMQDIEAVLGEDAKNNKQYQEAQKTFNKQQQKAQKLEARRSLLTRFKDTKEEKGTGAAVGELGGTALEGLKKTFAPMKGIFDKFGGIFKLLILPALLLIVNSPIFEIIKEKIKGFIDFFGEEGPFGEKGIFGSAGPILGIGAGTLLGGLAIATLLAPFKVIGGIGKLGAFIGGKLFAGVSGAVKSITAAVTGKKITAGGTPVKPTGQTPVKPAAGATPPKATTPPRPTPIKPPAGGGGGGISDKFKHLAKFPLLKKVATKIPFIGTALSVASLIQVLSDDSTSKKDKIQAVGGILGGLIGGLGGAKLGALVGLLGGGPIGALVGGLAGGLAGYFAGDYIGLKLAEFFINGKQPERPKVTATGGHARKSQIKKQKEFDRQMAMQKQGSAMKVPGAATATAAGVPVKSGPDFKGDRQVGITEREMMESGMDLGDADLAGSGMTASSRLKDKRDMKRGTVGREQLRQIRRAREAVRKEEEEAKAKQMPPAVIDGKTINVNEGGKTENNTSTSPSLRPTGSTGQLAMGAGSMTGGAYL